VANNAIIIFQVFGLSLPQDQLFQYVYGFSPAAGKSIMLERQRRICSSLAYFFCHASSSGLIKDNGYCAHLSKKNNVRRKVEGTG
jgi:hypothetical protein